jgi:hypothetical protein
MRSSRPFTEVSTVAGPESPLDYTLERLFYPVYLVLDDHDELRHPCNVRTGGDPNNSSIPSLDAWRSSPPERA